MPSERGDPKSPDYAYGKRHIAEGNAWDINQPTFDVHVSPFRQKDGTEIVLPSPPSTSGKTMAQWAK